MANVHLIYLNNMNNSPKSLTSLITNSFKAYKEILKSGSSYDYLKELTEEI